MGFLKLLSIKAPNKFFLAVVLGSIAGILYSLLIPLLLNSLAPAELALSPAYEQTKTILGVKVNNFALASAFFLICIGILLASSISEVLLLRIGADSACDLRKSVYNRVGKAPIDAIEQIGLTKLIASVNIDVPRIIAGARIMPAMFVNFITLAGMLGFLNYINPDVFNIVIGAVFLGLVIYQIPMSIGRAQFNRSREANDAAQESLKGLIFGAKELKLSVGKRRFFLDNVLLKHEETLVTTEKRAYTIMAATVSTGELLSFFVIGAITYIFVNYYPISHSTLLAVVMVLLYVKGPIGVILNSIPSLVIAGVSYKKINNLLAQIPEESASYSAIENIDWRTLRLEQATYAYPSDKDDAGFKVGPVTLEFLPESVSFIVGGNGSGKSTISKMLSMHYIPNQGQLFCDDTLVNSDNLNACRSQVFAIYTDYYLFQQLLFDVTPEIETKARVLLKMLCLEHKVSIEGGHFSTTSLSDGQRKRLSLLVAILEDKQLYLFDEWAADQDPDFRELFYKQILPELRRQKKTVIVISHDDKYYNIADQIIVVEHGKIASIEAPRVELAS